MRVALATTPDVPDTDQDDPTLLAAFAAGGHDASLQDWRDPAVDWSGFDAVVLRSVWDYDEDRDAFLAWSRGVGEVTGLWNPAEVVRWNTHKGYLLELEDRGAPVIPTAWLGAGDDIDLDELLRARGWAEAVVKPVVGAGARGVRRVTGDAEGQAALDELVAAGDVMVQPYLDRIAEVGELSVVVIDGAVTHAVRKVPRAGEFRIHVEHGGTYTREDLDDEVVRLAGWLVEATGHDLLYARADLVPDALGTWQLSELEATEPSLYLDHAPDAAARLVRAVERRAATQAAGDSSTPPDAGGS